MLTISENPETLEDVQRMIQKWLGNVDGKGTPFAFSRVPGALTSLRCVARIRIGLKLKMSGHWLCFERKQTRMELNMEKFRVGVALEGERVCVDIDPIPEAEHRFFDSALRDMEETKHPAFQSRVLRAFIHLEEELPDKAIEEAVGAPTDLLAALEALSSAPGVSQLIADDPFLAAKIRGLKRKSRMIADAGGALSSEQVADVLGISRQAVDKRRASNQLLALTQGRRGYSYPSFQFENGKTINGLEEVLTQLKALDPWMQMVFFTSPNERLGGKTPIESLYKGSVNEVVQAAGGYGEQGAQ